MVQQLFAQAVSLHQQGQLAQAQALYEQVLNIQSTHFDALHFLGIIAFQTRNLQRAVELIGQAISINPNDAIARYNFGQALQDLKQYEPAIQSYERAIALKPDFAEAYYNRGNALKDLKQLEAAIQSYGRAVALRPDYWEAYYNLGVALQGLKQPEAAIQSYDKVIALRPDLAETYNNRGNALLDLKQFEAAIQSYERAVALKPDFAEAYNNRGIALSNLKQLEAAIRSFDRAVALRPDYVEAYYYCGNALKELKRYEAAIQSYDRVIALRPDFAETYYNRGVTLQDLGRLEAAIQSYDRAIALDPDLAEAYTNRGMALSGLKRPEAAIQSYERIIALKPDFAEANFSLGLCQLQMGNFDEGWKKFEWRWKAEGLNLGFRQPQWSGTESLQGKTILLRGEHGLGDTIQFCRYAKLLADLGAQVILEVQEESLVDLLGTLVGVTQVIARGTALPAFDYHCPLMSLPLAFKTDLSNIPSADAYLTSDAGKLEKWRTRLGAANRPRVGLVWSGYKGHKNDRNRSIPLHDFVKALPKEIQYISLQKELRESDREALKSPPDILCLGADINDFTDTAALCELVDVVVTIDTSVAHLAGALGRPVWILLPFNPDWRWLLERDDSPWYPSAKLYRQERRGDWGGVIDKVNSDLSQLAGPRPESII